MVGVGPEALVVTNSLGGKGSDPIGYFHLIGYRFLIRLARRMKHGAKKYAPNNWRMCPPEEHYDHLMAHCLAALNGDTQDDHIGAIAARAMMLCESLEDGGALTEEQVAQRYPSNRA